MPFRRSTQSSLLSRFDFVECGDGDGIRAKPSPALYLSALARLGLSSHEAVSLQTICRCRQRSHTGAFVVKSRIDLGDESRTAAG